MQILTKFKKNKTEEKAKKRDYLETLGSEQIKKMIERGMQMPVISI